MIKRKLFILLFLTSLPFIGWAEPVDVETARQNATDFLRNHSSARRKDMMPANKPLRLLHTQRQENDDAPTLYVFGNEGDDGYVVIAGDDAAVAPVLGYSMKGRFNADSIPCNLRYWLDEYGKQLVYAREHPSNIVKRTPNETSRASIVPFTTSKWTQRKPFNNLCPKSELTEIHYAAGCIATAMAQLMYYHKWPKQGVGSHTYKWNNQTLSADFGATTYQWDKMKDIYDEDMSDPDDAVATLMYHCGVAVNMNYFSGGAKVSAILPALTQYFNYTPIGNHTGYKSYDYENLIYSELSEKAPVLVIGGRDENTHAFLCDGYDNGYFHFNFGWGGYMDDYYLLTAINPDSKYLHEDFSCFYGLRKSGIHMDDCDYAINPDGTATLLKGTASGDYAITGTVQIDGRDYPVKTIDDEAFTGCKELTSLAIPNSVTVIGNKAFKDCTELTSITIPEGVTSIGNSTFSNCKELTYIEIPTSVTTIGTSAFSGCIKLESVIIPESVTSIGATAFEYTPWYENQPDGMLYFGKVAFQYKGEMPENTSITIKDGTIAIAPKAFYKSEGNLGLTSIDIPLSVTTIGESAFSGCKNLTSIVIPENVTDIGSGAFAKCLLNSVTINCKTVGNKWFNGKTAIKEVIFGSGVAYIGESAFNGCKGLTSITFPNSMTSIGVSAFQDCTGLTSITIPDNVTSIGKSAFSGCTALASLTIGSGLTEMDYTSFKGCTALSSVTLDCPTVGTWFSGMTSVKELFIGKNVETIDNQAFCNCSGLETAVIADGVSSMGQHAFYGCTNLTSVTIPKSLTSISHYAFYQCSSLSTVNFDAGATSIGNYAFYGCSSLESLVIPNSVTSIGQNAFESSGLTSIIIPNSVTSIGMKAFENCTSLITASLSNSVTSISERTFSGCSALTSFIIPSSVTYIGNYAFSGCSALTSITIPSTVTSIYGNVFTDCSSLTTVDIDCLASISGCGFSGSTSIKEVIIGENVTAIGSSAFLNCTSLTSVTIHNGVTAIGTCAFRGCTGLTSVTIPNTVTTIGEEAFLYCTGLTAINLSENLTSIGISAFHGCTGLTSLILPNSLTDIGGEAFWGCTNLNSVTLSENLINIGIYAFSGCKSLTSITIPEKVSYIGNSAFKGCTSLSSVTVNSSTINSCFSKLSSITDLTFGENVTSIGSSAFSDCTGLTSITIPDNVTTIDRNAFSGCSGLTSITIPNSVTSIGDGTFGGCTSLNSIIIGRNVTSIGSGAFASCSSLTDVYCLANVPTTSYKAFYLSNQEEATLHVPSIYLEAYKTTLPWKKFGNVIALPKEMDLFILGDVNVSGVVDVQDATLAVNYILGKASDEDAFDFLVADMNGDGEVDVFDVTAIINVILSGNGNTAGARSLARGDENMESVRLATDEGSLLFGIDRADRFTSFQFDVEVPDGAKLEGVEWGSKTGHRLQFAKNGEHRYTVVALSLASKPLPVSDGTLLKLRLSDTVEGEVSIGNVLFVTPEGRAARFSGGTMSMATGIVSATLKDKGDEWYDLDGRKMSGQPKRKGVYIFNNKKVVIK